MNDNGKEELLDLYQKIFQDKGTPSDKNLFEMASLKEFRHSAILGYLLSRKEHGQCIHLKTLLGLIMPQDALVDVENVTVECELRVDCNNSSKRPIDILCQWGPDNDRKALIIENKCRGAADQENQIADYWEGVKALGYKEESIYVLYLPPMNGVSKPSEFSLGGLDFSSNLKGHLMVHSYRELILPWLKVDVLPQISYGHGALIDSLKSYIDLLEGAYGERPLSKDERAQDLDRLMKEKEINISDLSIVWNTTSDLLKKIENAMAEDQKLNPEDRREGDIRKFSELQAFLWRVRSLLREQNPLLDRDNLIYEVYWMLRNNPTPFGAKYLDHKLDSGSFFTARKGSIWDTCKINDHVVEVVCNSEELFYCLSKTTPEGENEQKKSVLQFGIGGVAPASADELIKSLTEKMGSMLGEMKFLNTKNWMLINVSNDVFNDAKNSHGGELLWKTAEVIAEVSRSFSEIIKAITLGKGSSAM